MSTEDMVEKEKQAFLALAATPATPTPSKKKRGRKPRSPPPPSPCVRSPPPPSPSPRSPLSFFKVLIGDFKKALFIPPMAACILKDLAKKHVYIEDAEGNYWSVKMSMVDGSLAFRKGWRDFVSDHSITAGELVVFTYTDGFLFTVRIYGTSALERVRFQKKKRAGGCTKEKRTAELKPDIVQTAKRLKESHALEEKHSSSGAEVLQSLKRQKKIAKCDFTKVQVIKSDSISEGAFEFTNAGEKLLYESNSKESENVLHNSEQTCHAKNNVTAGELNFLSHKKFAKSDMDFVEAVASKCIRNRMNTTEKEAAHLHSGKSLQSEQKDENSGAMSKSGTLAVKPLSDINKESAEISGLQVQMNKVNDEMKNSGNIEQDHSHEHCTIESELHNDKMASPYNPEHVECTPKKQLNMIEPEEEPISCQNDDETFGSETCVPCETVSVVFSNPISDHTDHTKENLMSISKEYGVPKAKGISCDAFFDEDAKDVTPCSSQKKTVKIDPTNSVDIPSSCCFSFRVNFSEDVHPSIELPEKLNCQMGRLKYERKIIVLQDPSMRCWPVMYHQSIDFVGFIGGWLDFVRANDIGRGDICELELVSKIEFKFRVRITKAEGSLTDGKVASP